MGNFYDTFMVAFVWSLAVSITIRFDILEFCVSVLHGRNKIMQIWNDMVMSK